MKEWLQFTSTLLDGPPKLGYLQIYTTYKPIIICISLDYVGSTHHTPEIPYVLVGNKCDRLEERQISTSEAQVRNIYQKPINIYLYIYELYLPSDITYIFCIQEFGYQNNLFVIETSAKEGININRLFSQACYIILQG